MLEDRRVDNMPIPSRCSISVQREATELLHYLHVDLRKLCEDESQLLSALLRKFVIYIGPILCKVISRPHDTEPVYK